MSFSPLQCLATKLIKPVIQTLPLTSYVYSQIQLNETISGSMNSDYLYIQNNEKIHRLISPTLYPTNLFSQVWHRQHWMVTLVMRLYQRETDGL